MIIDSFDFDVYKDTLVSVSNDVDMVYRSPYLRENQIDIINSCITDLKGKLREELLRLDYYKNENSENINAQYKQYITNRIGRIFATCNLLIASGFSIIDIVGTLTKLKDQIGDDSVFRLLQCFRHGDSNFILFGKNGSGKTSLLERLHGEVFNTNSIIVRATRDINYNPDSYFRPDEATLNNALSCNEKAKTMFLLSRAVLEKEITERREGKSEDSIISKLIIETFGSLGMDRELSIDTRGSLRLSAQSGKDYLLADASDGEKAALLLIMVTFLAPSNSFIFIDEPENHLNGALMMKLFDCLERQRGDIKFIYSTHNTGFIESRNNVEIIYLKKTKERGSWEFHEFNSFGDLPLDVLLNVEGTNDDVLFCEGETSVSYDYKLYKTLYPDYKIIPSNGCKSVISRTAVFNENKKILRREAFGIVDHDARNSSMIEELKKTGVFVLKVNEVENVFLLDQCIQLVLEHLGSDVSVHDTKEKLIEIIKVKSEDVKKDFLTKLIGGVHSRNRVDSIDDIDSLLDRINQENNTAIKNAFSAFSKSFDQAVYASDFRSLMVLVPGKMIIDQCAKLLGLAGKDVYINLSLNLLKKRSDVRAALKNEMCDLR